MSALRFRFLATWAILAITAAAVSSCASGTAGQSGRSEGESGAAAQSAELRMSGGYVVNEDGTLRKPETTMTEPVLNRAALRFDAEGAELAARHYLALTEYAWATGDTGPLDAMSESECVYCRHTIERIDQTYREGGWIDELEYKIIDVSRVEEIESEESEIFGVEMNVETSDSVAYEPPKVVRYEGSDENLSLFVRWIGNQWVVVGGAVGESNA